MAPNFFSTAFNFRSHNDLQVDARTGEFGVVFPLTSIRPEGVVSGQRDICLRFSMYQPQNKGYGLGWSLNETVVVPDDADDGPMRVILSDGTCFPLADRGSHPFLQFHYRRLENFSIEKTDENTLKIYYPDGTLEIMKRRSFSKLFKTDRLFFENGESFFYYYHDKNDRLRSINNQNFKTGNSFKKYIEIEYDDAGNIQSAKILTTNLEYKIFNFITKPYLFDGESKEKIVLSNILLPGNTNSEFEHPSGSFNYRYDRLGLQQNFYGVIAVESPEGGLDEVLYEFNGLSCAGSKLPRVKNWIRKGYCKQPPINRSYVFSQDTNFTGNPDKIDGRSGEDYCYKRPNNYEYSSIETVEFNDGIGAASWSRKCTFNRYHLLTKEQIICSSNETTTTILYEQEPVATTQSGTKSQFQDSPLPQFPIPSEINVEYANGNSGTRQERTLITSDRFGNTLSCTASSGIVTKYDYYPISGDGDECPAEPFGQFQRYLKEETITPAPMGASAWLAPGRKPSWLVPQSTQPVPRRTRFTYAKTLRKEKTSDGTGRKYFVQCVKKLVDNEIAGIHQTTYQYRSQGDASAAQEDPLWCGQLVKMEAVVRTAGRDYPTTVDFIHTLSTMENTRCLTETRTIRGFEGTVVVGTRCFDLVTGQMLRIRKPGGAEISFQYDAMGRLKKEAIGAAARDYTYVYAKRNPQTGEVPDAGSAHLIVSDKTKGGQTYIVLHDGLGRPVCSLIEAENQIIRETGYDGMGRKIREVVHDDPDGKKLRLETRYQYNGWGEVSRTCRPDGSVVLSDRDYVANTLITGIDKLNTKIIEYNNFSLVARVTEVSDDGKQKRLILAREYDGYGRCILERDVDLNITLNNYDNFDRLIRMHFLAANDGMRRDFFFHYAPHSAGAFQSKVHTPDATLGKRSFDDLGRLKKEVRQGVRPTIYGYTDSKDKPAENILKPSTSEAASGVITTLTYDTNLSLVTRITKSTPPSRPNGAPGILDEVVFAYDLATGRMTNAKNGESERSYAYDKNGHLKTETLKITPKERQDNRKDEKQRTWTIHTAYSRGGRLWGIGTPTSATDESQQDHFERRGVFDDDGSLKKLESDEGNVSHYYDGQGRLKRVDIAIDNPRLKLQTELTFDSWGREASRKLAFGAEPPHSIRREYHPNGNLAYRRLCDERETVLIEEEFTYDTCARLSAYSCRNLQAPDERLDEFPKDSRDRAITHQTFRYNDFDNITEVTTQFVGGASEISYRRYDNNGAGLLRTITNTATGDRELRYDVDGNLVFDGNDRHFAFNSFGRLDYSHQPAKSATQSGDNTVQHYHHYRYDALGRLIREWTDDDKDQGHDALVMHYAAGQLVAETKADSDGRPRESTVRYLRDDGRTLGRHVALSSGPDKAFAELYATTETGSVVGQAKEDKEEKTLGSDVAAGLKRRLYTPYGEAGRSTTTLDTPLIERHRIAFNGERFDDWAGVYHLGNGRRAYSPELMMFLTPDPLVPFDGAGWGLYSFCHGDPINFSDPSGLVSEKARQDVLIASTDVLLSLVVLGFAIAAFGSGGLLVPVLGVIGATLGVAGATVGLAGAAIALDDENRGLNRSGAVNILNWISVGLSTLSVAVSVSAVVAKGISAGVALRTGIANGIKTAEPASMSTSVRRGMIEAAKELFGLGDISGKAITGVGSLFVGGLTLGQGIRSIAESGGTSSRIRRRGWSGPSLPMPGNIVAPAGPAVAQFEDEIVRLHQDELEFDQTAARIRGSFCTQLYGGTM